MKTIVFGAFAISGLIWSHAQQNLLLNGSFEAPAIAADSIMIAVPAEWQGNSSVRIINGDYSVPDLIGPQDGQQYVSLGNDGTQATIAQNFTVATAGSYELTWYDTVGNAPGFTSPFRVTVLNGANVVASEDFLGNADAIWTARSMPISLTPGTYTLTFSSLQPSPGGASVQIDNVKLPSSSAVVDFSVSVSVSSATPAGDLAFCSVDSIHCDVTTAIPSGNSVHWLIEPADTSSASATYFLAVPNSGDGPAFDFALTNLNNWLAFTPGGTGFENRPTLSFHVTATLSDGGGNPVGNPVTKTIQQSDVGQLRQEYADFPVTAGVPNVADFTAAHPELNSGDYANALLTGWAIDSAPLVIQTASSASPAMNTTVTSGYRNPVRHANIYFALGIFDVNAMDWASQHLYGAALDFRVGPEFASPPTKLTKPDYNRLDAVCAQFGAVIVERDTHGQQILSYVHLQQP